MGVKKAYKINLIKFRQKEIQRHIGNQIKHKIKLLWKNKIALTLFINYNSISDVRKDSQDGSETDKIYPYQVLKYPKSN